MSSSLHYGGSLRSGGSSTPGLSPAPARRRGRPSQNTSFQAQKRFEMIARLENAGIPEQASASMLGITLSRLRYLKKMPEYLIVRMKITHGIILDHEQQVAQIREQRKEILVQMLPPALQVIANTLLSQANSYAERKLQVDVAKDVLDRSDIFAKVSRTELKPVTHFDFERADSESQSVLAALRGAASTSAEIDTIAATQLNEAFSAQSAGLNEVEQQAALASLEDSSSESEE